MPIHTLLCELLTAAAAAACHRRRLLLPRAGTAKRQSIAHCRFIPRQAGMEVKTVAADVLFRVFTACANDPRTLILDVRPYKVSPMNSLFSSSFFLPPLLSRRASASGVVCAT